MPVRHTIPLGIVIFLVRFVIQYCYFLGEIIYFDNQVHTLRTLNLNNTWNTTFYEGFANQNLSSHVNIFSML